MYTKYINANRGNMDAQERHKRVADLQREIMMTESDLKKFVNEKTMLEGEKRRIRKEADVLRGEMLDRERKMRVTDQNIAIKRAEIVRLRKLLNVL